MVLNFFVINLLIAEHSRRPDRLLVKATTAWLPAETKIIETVDGMLNELNAKRHFLNVSPGSRNQTAFNQSSDTMENGQGGTMISTSTASVRVHDAYQTSLASCEDKSKTQHNQACVRNGTVYKCLHVPGSLVYSSETPSPTRHCLDGSMSMDTCRDGDFLCIWNFSEYQHICNNGFNWFLFRSQIGSFLFQQESPELIELDCKSLAKIQQHSLEEKKKTEERTEVKTQSGCSLQGIQYMCMHISGHQLESFMDRSPRLDCLGGKESWGVCEPGAFLCYDTVSEGKDLLPVSQRNHPGATDTNFCFSNGTWLTCRSMQQASIHFDDCLSPLAASGICGLGESLCAWSDMQKYAPENGFKLEQYRKKSGPNVHCLPEPSSRPDQFSVHIVVPMRDQSPSMKVLDDIALLGLTKSTVFLYHRADLGVNIQGLLSTEPVAGLPCGMKVIEKVLSPNRGNEAATYLSYMEEFYEKLPSMALFIHDHGFDSWHSQFRPMYKRSRSYYMGVASQHIDMQNKNSAFTKLLQMPSYRDLLQFSSNVVSLNSCYHSKGWNRTPLCHPAYTLNDYEKETNQSIQDLSDDLQTQRLSEISGSLSSYDSSQRHFSKHSMKIGRSLMAWNSEEIPFSLTSDLFSRIHKQYGMTMRSDDFGSCCAMFIAQPKHIRRQPRMFYSKSLQALLSTHLLSHHTGRWFEFNWYRLLHDNDVQVKRSLYVDIDDVYAEWQNLDRKLADLHEIID